MDHEPTKTEEGLTERDKVALFIGENAEAFMPYYDWHIANEKGEKEWVDQNGVTRQNTRPFTFNIAGLFVPLAWTLYRKDMMLTLVWVGITVVLLTLGLGGLPDFVGYAVAFGYALMFDQAYVSNVIHKVRDIAKRGQSPEYERSALEMEGGVSTIGAGVGVAVYLGIIVLSIIAIVG